MDHNTIDTVDDFFDYTPASFRSRQRGGPQTVLQRRLAQGLEKYHDNGEGVLDQPHPSQGDMRSRFERFSATVRSVLALAQEEAQRLRQNYIGTEHILLGLVRETEGVAARVLSSLTGDLSKVRPAVEFIIGRGDKPREGKISLTPRAEKVVELAVDEARRMNHTYVGTQHLLIGLLREGGGVGVFVLETLGVNVDKARAETYRISSYGASRGASGSRGADTKPYRLDRFGGKMTSQLPDPQFEVVYVGDPYYLATGKSVVTKIARVGFGPEKHVEVIFHGSTEKIWRDASALRSAGKRMPVEGLAVVLDRDERDPNLAHQVYPVSEISEAGWGLVDFRGRSFWMPPRSPKVDLGGRDRVIEVPQNGQFGPFLHLALQGYLLEEGPKVYIDEWGTEVNLWGDQKGGDSS